MYGSEEGAVVTRLVLVVVTAAAAAAVTAAAATATVCLSCMGVCWRDGVEMADALVFGVFSAESSSTSATTSVPPPKLPRRGPDTLRVVEPVL